MKNFAWWLEKVFIHTNIWMAWKNLRRQVYHWKMRFPAGLICAASLDYHGDKGHRLLSRYLLKNRCFAVGRCIWDISQYVLKKLQIGSSIFLHRTRISMADLIKDSRWVLWASKIAQKLWIMPRRVQDWAAYGSRDTVYSWKRYLGRDYPSS